MNESEQSKVLSEHQTAMAAMSQRASQNWRGAHRIYTQHRKQLKTIGKSTLSTLTPAGCALFCEVTRYGLEAEELAGRLSLIQPRAASGDASLFVVDLNLARIECYERALSELPATPASGEYQLIRGAVYAAITEEDDDYLRAFGARIRLESPELHTRPISLEILNDQLKWESKDLGLVANPEALRKFGEDCHTRATRGGGVRLKIFRDRRKNPGKQSGPNPAELYYDRLSRPRRNDTPNKQLAVSHGVSSLFQPVLSPGRLWALATTHADAMKSRQRTYAAADEFEALEDPNLSEKEKRKQEEEAQEEAERQAGRSAALERERTIEGLDGSDLREWEYENGAAREGEFEEEDGEGLTPETASRQDAELEVNWIEDSRARAEGQFPDAELRVNAFLNAGRSHPKIADWEQFQRAIFEETGNLDLCAFVESYFRDELTLNETAKARGWTRKDADALRKKWEYCRGAVLARTEIASCPNRVGTGRENFPFAAEGSLTVCRDRLFGISGPNSTNFRHVPTEQPEPYHVIEWNGDDPKRLKAALPVSAPKTTYKIEISAARPRKIGKRKASTSVYVDIGRPWKPCPGIPEDIQERRAAGMVLQWDCDFIKFKWYLNGVPQK